MHKDERAPHAIISGAMTPLIYRSFDDAADAPFTLNATVSFRHDGRRISPGRHDKRG